MAVRGTLIAGLPHLALLPGAEGKCGSPAASMPASRLLTPEPSERARVTTLLPTETYFAVRGPQGCTPTAYLLVNTNARGLTGVWRVRTYGSAATWQTVSYIETLPNSTLASSNLTGSHADVDESASSPDGNLMRPTSTGTVWSARLGFATPSQVPVIGAYAQTFGVYCTRKSTGTYPPTIGLALYDNGVLIETLETKTVTSTTGQWLLWHWDADQLANSLGDQVEVLITGTPGIDGTAAVAYVDVDVVRWWGDTSAQSGHQGSGWQRLPRLDDPGFFGDASASSLGPGWQRILAWTPEEGVLAGTHRQWVFDVKDDLVEGEDPVETWMEAGFCSASAGLTGDQLECYVPQSTRFGIEQESEGGGGATSGGGQSYDAVLWQRRAWQLVMHYRQSNWEQLLERLFWRVGALPMLIVLLPDDPVPHRRMLFARLQLQDWVEMVTGEELVEANIRAVERV